jgi:hypothetical protein
MKIARIYCYILFGLLLYAAIYAAPQLSMEVSDDGQGNAGVQDVYVDIPFEVTVTVSNGDRDTGQVDFDASDQVKIAGSGKSTNITMVNGKFSSQTTYTFQLYALKEGDIKIGPAHLNQGGQVINSNILTLKAGKAQNQSRSNNQAEQATSTQNTTSSEQQTVVLCRLTAHKKNAYIGEPIIVKMTILSRGTVLQVAIEPPKFPGFTVKENQNVTRRQESLKNVPYNVLEKQYVLYPTGSGVKIIDPVRVSYTMPVKQRPRHHSLFDEGFFADFFDQGRVQQKTVTSNSLQLSVEKLPEDQGEVDGVGEFTSFTATINKKKANVNEALTLTLEIVGKGNLDQVVAPKLILPDFIKAYDSKSTIHEDLTSDHCSGKKAFEYILQIAQGGDQEIPSQQFVYFDSVNKSVKTLKTLPILVQLTSVSSMPPQNISPKKALVEQEDEEISPEPQKQKKIENNDISFIQEDGPIMCHAHRGFNVFIFLLLLLLIPFIFWCKRITDYFKKILFPRLIKNRSRRKNLDQLDEKFDTLKNGARMDQLYQFYIHFFATKYGVEDKAVTHELIKEYLDSCQWEESKINDFFDFLNECASFQFLSGVPHDKTNKANPFKRGAYWLLLLKK